MPTYAGSLCRSKKKKLNMISFAALECPKISLKNGSISTRRQIDFAYINGTLEYIDRRPHYLSTASFSCNHGFTLVGHSVATCMANSKWNVPLPKCTMKSLYAMLNYY